MIEGRLRHYLQKLQIEIVRWTPNGWAIGHCPFAPYLHDGGADRNPGFCAHADPEKVSGFNCFSCHQHGNIFSLVRRLEFYRGESYGSLAEEAMLDEVPRDFGAWSEREMAEAYAPPPASAALFESMYPEAAAEREAMAYLKGRGVGADAAALLRLRYDPEQRRVLFPCVGSNGALYGWSGRSVLHPDYLAEKGWPKVRDYDYDKRLNLMGEHLIGENYVPLSKPLYVVEGPMALAHLIEIGALEICYPVATLGSALSDAQARSLAAYDTKTYLGYDPDEAGLAGIWGGQRTDGSRFPGAADKLRAHVPVAVPRYPPGVCDPDDLTLPQLRRMVDTDYDLVGAETVAADW